MKSTAWRVLFASLPLIFAAGCDNTKSLPGNYQLERWEDNKTYYLHGPSHVAEQGGGLIEGTVLRLAWNDEMIGVERYATFRGDRDGWMVIDIKSGRISGPVSGAEFETIRNRYRLQVQTASVAWDKL